MKPSFERLGSLAQQAKGKILGREAEATPPVEVAEQPAEALPGSLETQLAERFIPIEEMVNRGISPGRLQILPTGTGEARQATEDDTIIARVALDAFRCVHEAQAPSKPAAQKEKGTHAKLDLSQGLQWKAETEEDGGRAYCIRFDVLNFEDAGDWDVRGAQTFINTAKELGIQPGRRRGRSQLWGVTEDGKIDRLGYYGELFEKMGADMPQNLDDEGYRQIYELLDRNATYDLRLLGKTERLILPTPQALPTEKMIEYAESVSEIVQRLGGTQPHEEILPREGWTFQPTEAVEVGESVQGVLRTLSGITGTEQYMEEMVVTPYSPDRPEEDQISVALRTSGGHQIRLCLPFPGREKTALRTPVVGSGIEWQAGAPPQLNQPAFFGVQMESSAYGLDLRARAKHITSDFHLPYGEKRALSDKVLMQELEKRDPDAAANLKSTAGQKLTPGQSDELRRANEKLFADTDLQKALVQEIVTMTEQAEDEAARAKLAGLREVERGKTDRSLLEVRGRISEEGKRPG